MDLYKFQREKIEDGDIAKFINILPIKEDIAAIHSAFNNSIRSEEKIGNSERLAFLQKKFLDVFLESTAKYGALYGPVRDNGHLKYDQIENEIFDEKF